MPKLKSYKVYAPEPQFLAIPDHYVNLTGKIAYADLAGLAVTTYEPYKGESVIPRGTVVNLDSDGTVKAVTESLKGNAIIFNTIKVADYDEVDTEVNATVLVHGFVRTDRLHGTLEENDMIYQLSE